MQEMLIHLGLSEAKLPGNTHSWHIKGCEFHGRDYLNRGRSINSLKRQNNLLPLGEEDDESVWSYVEAVDPVDLRSELIVRDIVGLMAPQLTDTQQLILSLLMHDCGVCEIARELCVSHPTIIKNRKKIAQIASRLLTDAGSSVKKVR